MASISGSVTIAGDPDDWIATAFDADTHAFAGVAAVSAGSYEITGLTAGKAYVVACRPKSGPAWADGSILTRDDYITPSNPTVTPYIYKATSMGSTKLLLNFDGSNGSTTLTDTSDNALTVTASGNAQLSTAQYKYGTASLYLDGTTDYATAAHSSLGPGTGPFTIECWVRPADVTNAGIFQLSATAGGFETTNRGLVLAFNSGGGGLSYSSVGADRLVSASFSLNQWVHIALCRANDDKIRVFVDGQKRDERTDTTDYSSLNNLVIGGYYSTAYTLSGYIDDFRHIVGAGLYADAFTPPASALAALGKTGASEPTWPTTPGNTIVDGDVTWTNMGQLLDPLIAGPLIAV